MVVPVVQIRIVRMFVVHRFVAVPMRMRFSHRVAISNPPKGLSPTSAVSSTKSNMRRQTEGLGVTLDFLA